jgi:hypothetical protein
MKPKITVTTKKDEGKGNVEKTEESSKFKKSDVITNPYFTTASILAIILNTIIMSLYNIDMTPSDEQF